jgi:hypothetical protein
MNRIALYLRCAAALATAFPLLAHAQDAAQPDAKVPAVQYRSVFKDTPTGVENETADWKKANQEVGQFLRGHVDVLKWEEQQQAKPSMQKPAPAGELPAQDAMKPVAPNTHKH